MLPPLNLPSYPFKLRDHSGKAQVFDEVRKKWVALTPEEWVRQHWISFLILEKAFPLSLLQVEKSFQLNGLAKRIDILGGYPPRIIVECKAPGVSLSKAALHQALRYNLAWKVEWLVISNGLQHVLFKVDLLNEKVNQADELPNWTELV